MRNTIEICGEDFVELIPSSVAPRFGYTSVYSAYGRCSEAKQEIWEYWRDWLWRVGNAYGFGGFGDWEMWVSSRNTCQFTIGGKMVYNGKRYAFYITKTRQEVWELV